jgi:hypothetical protein
VKSMSEKIAASMAARSAARPAQKATKMAAITATGEIAGGANSTAAADSGVQGAETPKGRRGRRRKKEAKATGSRAGVARRAETKRAIPASQARAKPDKEKKKGAKAAFFFTTLLVVGAGVGGQYAVNEGLITPPWAEPAIVVDDCVQGAEPLGSLAADTEISVEKVSCDLPQAQTVIAEVDDETQCPAEADGVVSAGSSLFCVAGVLDDTDLGS